MSDIDTIKSRRNRLRRERAKVLGANVARAMRVAGYVNEPNKINQSELAEKCMCSRSTVSQIIAGKANPDLETLSTIANALGVSPAFLLMGPKEWTSILAVISTIVTAKREFSAQIKGHSPEDIAIAALGLAGDLSLISSFRDSSSNTADKDTTELKRTIEKSVVTNAVIAAGWSAEVQDPNESEILSLALTGTILGANSSVE